MLILHVCMFFFLMQALSHKKYIVLMLMMMPIFQLPSKTQHEYMFIEYSSVQCTFVHIIPEVIETKSIYLARYPNHMAY